MRVGLVALSAFAVFALLLWLLHVVQGSLWVTWIVSGLAAGCVGFLAGWAWHLRQLLAEEEHRRVQAERAAQTSSAHLQLAMDQLPGIAWTTDEELRFTSGMGAGLAALNIQQGQLGQMPLHTFFGTGDDTFAPIAAHRRALQGETVQMAFSWVGRNYQVRVQPFRDKSGRIAGTIGLAVDVTERLRAEEAHRRAHHLESLGMLAQGVAHDFNNLLAVVLGQASLALLRLPAGSPVQEHLEKAMAATERAGRLTHQLLAYGGKVPFEVKEVNLNTLIRDNLPLLQAAAPRGVYVETELHDPLPDLAGDPTQVQQILVNLVLNALEAMSGREGSVTLRTHVADFLPRPSQPAHRPRDHTGAPLPPGRYILLQVADQGPGLSDEEQARMFDPFYTTRETGRGMGLPVVLGLANAHGGHVAVDSELGLGTTFNLYLPAGEPPAPTVPGRPPELDERRGAGRVVLVIDDEEGVREVVRDILENDGLRVLAAPGGPEGVDLYREQQAIIDLVLLDLTMPGMNGEETLHRLQAVNPDARIILTSGFAADNMLQRLSDYRTAGSPGTVSFLQKPYDAAELLAALYAQLEGDEGDEGVTR